MVVVFVRLATFFLTKKKSATDVLRCTDCGFCYRCSLSFAVLGKTGGIRPWF